MNNHPAYTWSPPRFAAGQWVLFSKRGKPKRGKIKAVRTGYDGQLCAQHIYHVALPDEHPKFSGTWHHINVPENDIVAVTDEP